MKELLIQFHISVTSEIWSFQRLKKNPWSWSYWLTISRSSWKVTKSDNKSNLWDTFFAFKMSHMSRRRERSIKKVSLITHYTFHLLLAVLSYRIYSRISREILDTFCQIFFQFDLYAGHKLCWYILVIYGLMTLSARLHYNKHKTFFWNFGQI